MSTSEGPARAALPPQRKPRKSRGRGLRTNTGCTICRKRHMKCDETRPICGPCARGGRSCDYEASAASPAGPSGSPVNGPGSLQHGRTRGVSSSSAGAACPWPPKQPRIARAPKDDSSYATERAPAGWFGLLSTDTTDVDLDVPPQAATTKSDRSEAESAEDSASNGRPYVMEVSTIAPSSADDELRLWQTQQPFQLQGLELDMFEHFLTVVCVWYDLFDPLRHFSSLVPHMALQNEGLMKAILAMGARHLEAKASSGSCEAVILRTAAVQYYAETLQYLQSAMRYTSYKSSQELLPTTLVISTYEMLDRNPKGWDRHLKGVFWIQRSREITGESGGLEQAVWWAWLHQDTWAAFTERRRCFSFFKPTRLYAKMSRWDVALRMTYIFSQCVNFISTEEKCMADTDPPRRLARANELSQMLSEWYSHRGPSFIPLPVAETSSQPFRPIWIHPSAFSVSVQMYYVARILLVSHKPVSGNYLESTARDHEINECVEMVAGISLRSPDNASRPLSTHCLYAAGLFCSDAGLQERLLEVLEKDAAHTGWPISKTLAGELRTTWANR